MPGMPKRRAKREAAGLPVAPRSMINLSPVVLRRMRERGVEYGELVRYGLDDKNRSFVMGYDGESTPGVLNDYYSPTGPERDAVQNWVVAGYKSPLKLKEMLLEDFDLDLSVSVIQRAFRIELALGKERVAVQATKNVMASIKEGDVQSSFRFLESAGKWNAKDAPPPAGNVTINNTQINITPENAAAEYQKLVKGG